MRHPALSYTPRLLVLGTQQVLHHFDGREGRNGHVHEDRIPLGHGAVPQAGKFLRAQIAAAARLRRNEARRRIGVPAQSKRTPFEFFMPQTRSTGLKCVADRISGRSSGPIWLDSAIWSDCVPSGFPTQKGPPPGSPSLRTMPQTRIGRSSTARSMAES